MSESEPRRDSGGFRGGRGGSAGGRGGGRGGFGSSGGGGFSRGGASTGRGGGRGGSSSSSSMPYNPKLARFQKQNPGSGPHGFGGTYKKGEKGGHRTHAHDDEHIPLAERGLRKPGGAAQFPAARKPAAASSSSSAAPPQKAGTTAIKSKIRDLTRLLKKKDLDPAIKKHKEHELLLTQQALKDQEAANAAAKIDARYKTIKFYERRKITRKLAGLQRQLANLFSHSSGDAQSAEEKSIRRAMATLQLDADYIDLYPSGEKYVSLFKTPGDKKKAAEGSDDEDGEEPEEPASDEEKAADGTTGSKPKPAVDVAALRRAVEEARAAMRKRVAKIKAEQARAAAAAAGPVQHKRKREEVRVTDELFQQVDDEPAAAAAAPATAASAASASASAATPAATDAASDAAKPMTKKQRLEAKQAAAGGAGKQKPAPAASSARSAPSKPAAPAPAAKKDEAAEEELFQDASDDDDQPMVEATPKPTTAANKPAKSSMKKKRDVAPSDD